MNGTSIDAVPLLSHHLLGHFEEENEHAAVSAFFQIWTRPKMTEKETVSCPSYLVPVTVAEIITSTCLKLQLVIFRAILRKLTRVTSLLLR